MFQIYVSEGLRMIAENTSRYAGGTYMKHKFYDTVNVKDNTLQDDRTAEEVVIDILQRAEITIGGE